MVVSKRQSKQRVVVCKNRFDDDEGWVVVAKGLQCCDLVVLLLCLEEVLIVLERTGSSKANPKT